MPHTNEVDLLENQGWDERILVCRNGQLVKTFIVVTDRCVVLVDSLINAKTASRMLDYARPYLAGTRALVVVNTHADYDHAWGNQLFAGPAASHPAPIIGSQRCAEELRSSGSATYLQEMRDREPEIFAGVQLVEPTICFEEGLTIGGGDLTLQLFATPGHTPDHIALYIPEIETLLAADGAELPYPAARAVDGLPAMRASLARMAALQPKVTLYCHAPVTIGPQLLHDNIAYFDALERHCRAALARGVPARPDQDADVIDLVGCRYEDVTPAGPMWEEVHEHYRTQGHAEQLRMMLAWLADAK